MFVGILTELHFLIMQAVIPTLEERGVHKKPIFVVLDLSLEYSGDRPRRERPMEDLMLALVGLE